MKDPAIDSTHGPRRSSVRRPTAGKRLRGWLTRRFMDRVRWMDGPAHLAWHPDSHFVLGRHPEAHDLYERWIRGNRRNNGGDLARLHSFILNIKQCLAEGVRGEFAELGVWRGNSAAVLAHFAAGADRRVFLFDTFSGFDQRDLQAIDRDRAPQFADSSLDVVRHTVGQPAHTTYVPGFFPESITESARQAVYAFVSVDCDLYAPMKAALDFFYPRLSRGGTLFLHDYSSGIWPGATQAIDEFRASTGELLVLLPDKSGTAVIRRAMG